MNDNTVSEWLKTEAARFEQEFWEYLPSGSGIVCEAARYSAKAPGKRIRPVLLLSVCELLGGARERALPLAAALEMTHVYSLIHDDLPCMDDDDFRRGLPSCHRQFDEAFALLAGDALLTQAFLVLAKSGNSPELCVESINILATAAGTDGMIMGQELDLRGTGELLARPELERMNRMKTGALLHAACVLGGLAAGTNMQNMKILGAYADALGLLFQITDDLLDVDGTMEDIGKTPGKDAAAEKSSWVRVLGMEEAIFSAKHYATLAQESILRLTQVSHPLFLLPGWLLMRKK